MARNYYTLVAGLREFTLDADNKGFDARAIKEEIYNELSDADRRSMRLFYLFYDITNIVNIRAGRSQFSDLGNFTRERLEQELAAPELLPQFIVDIVRAYDEPDNADYDGVDKTGTLERALFTAYYERCRQSGCEFVRRWYEFDRNLRNVTAAYSARRLHMPVADVLVGEGYVADTLARSSAADFGLRGELPYIDSITDAVAEEGNLVGKERRIDEIWWEMADELTTFDYFNIDRILAYLVKVNIVHRWMSLDPQYGREMFRKLLDSFDGKEILGEANQQNEKR